MICREFISLLAVLLLTLSVGYGYLLYSGEPDSTVEEAAENVLNEQLENYFGFPDDSINIDLSPGSEEQMSSRTSETNNQRK